MSTLNSYTVFGIYADTDQRWCDSFEARDPAHAQELALDDAGSNLLIAGVIEGQHHCVDREKHGADEPEAIHYQAYRYGEPA